ncbi:atrial natriuretic peptide receptor 2-like [Serinus canaria]|uniref:atrial natriuretic peptide receptor 2-like n=1 Tax=Serinus canaria TaxID=9135 RepID=UPI0021CCE34C|nr:atrial natriuretic peptide receptor 2-like [Serinus canaria]
MGAVKSPAVELRSLLSFLVVLVEGWHDLDNKDYDCWPLEKPDEYNMLDCGGLEMTWVERPPEKAVSGESFNVTYAVFASDSFYQYAVQNGILSHSNATAAKEFCEEHDCPARWKDANGDNCCVYHANIHSCPLAFMAKGGICGPWIPDDGQIFTHTLSTAGKMSQRNWTAKVVLVHVGVTSLIAHIRVGRIQAALEAKTTVLPAAVCGDGFCEEEEGCSICPADCGECPLSVDVRIAIALPICLVCTGFILTVIWFQYQKQKMLWDESWIIDFTCIKQDYGLQSYRKEDFPDGSNSSQQHLIQIYTAPEIHTFSDFEPKSMSDVYSYAIILLEIATRSDPLKDDVHSAEYSWCPPLAECISGKAENSCPCPADYVELIERCRKNNPSQRPTFEQVKKMLYKMNPVSPVDMMMTLMEKYNKHLEILVSERTQDLMHEKQKTDRLLYSMLPKQVADDLRQGKQAQAQSYSSATIFFSDIVGFTELSSSSTPYQVVDLLNKLYTTFDEIIDNYDVYKVETIGDAYMVVSGVPKENGILHAGEIASMALDLLDVCRTFKIPHKPNTLLKIRAGIHSGAVVAGVVGTKMPRYCLFGDTVNTASRMESTSEALKIQCSSSAYQLLEQIGEYVLVCRGNLQVKGKGDMVTYWLEGKKASVTPKAVTSTSVTPEDANRFSYSPIPGVLSSDPL